MTTTVQEPISLERSDKFEGWAVVELMGHKKLAGFVTEQVVAGAALLRVDVPETQQRKFVEGYGGYTAEVKPGYTKMFGAGAIYCLTPTNEATARACAQEIERYNDPLPVTLPKLLSASAASTPASDTVDAEIVEENLTTLQAICPQCGASVDQAGCLCADCDDDDNDGNEDFDDDEDLP